MSGILPAILLVLAADTSGTPSILTDSVSMLPDRAALSDSALASGGTGSVGVPDSLPDTAPGRIPVPGIPFIVSRWRAADLDTLPRSVRGGGASAGASAPYRPREVPEDTSSGLVFSGHKTIRVGVGGEGGVAVDQSLLLDASGEIAPGVQVKAHLSDQQVPLGAEGGSEALRELDEVYVQVKTRRWDLMAGDQDWTLSDGATPGASRRLRGLSTGWNDGWSARATFGSPHARWMRKVFDGVEGRQEGWMLPGPEGRSTAPVVPGSERVTVNGVRMVAGTDYTLRAAEGMLDFLPRRRISASDRIEVEWQAAVLDYQRSLQAGQGALGAREEDGARWEVWAVREADDPSRPLSFAASEEADSVLREAGADASKAVLSDSAPVPLPTGRDDAGFRLGWRGGERFDVEAELRGTRTNPNLASTRDDVVDGAAGALDASGRLGDPLSDGGRGVFGATLRLRGNQEGFAPLSGRRFASESGVDSWNGDGGEPEGRSWETSGGLSWEAERDLGVWTEGGMLRDGGALASRAGASVGLKGEERRILSEMSFARRQETERSLDRWWTRDGARWRFGWFVPRVEGEGEDRQVGVAGDSGMARHRWGASRAGVAMAGFDGRMENDLSLEARLDQSDRSGRLADPEDSARSRGFRAESKWTDQPLSLDALLDGKLVEKKASDGAWIPDQSWLGETHAMARPRDGIELDARWRLSLSEFLPEVDAWDTVPKGTGTHKWDSISRQIVTADDGDLLRAGSRIDTTRPPIRSAQRLLALEATLEPGRIWDGLEGVLADVGLHGRGEWEQADSSAEVRFLPSMSDRGLLHSVQGRSSLQGDAWWARGGHRLDVGVEREWIVSGASSYSLATLVRDLVWNASWEWSSDQGHRTELPWRRADRILSGQNLSRREIVDVLDPAVTIRLVRILDVRPSVLLASGTGRDGDVDMEGVLVAPTLGLLVRLGRTGTLRSELRRAQARVSGPGGANLTEGFSDGRTWRASAGLDWTIDKHFSASADWVLRVDPGAKAFQKASAEARAVF